MKLKVNSDPFNTPLDGSFIKEWVWYHMNHLTKYSKIASGLKKVFNLDDNKVYILQKEIDEINIVEVNT